MCRATMLVINNWYLAIKVVWYGGVVNITDIVPYPYLKITVTSHFTHQEK